MRTTETRLELVKINATLLLIRTIIHDDVGRVIPAEGHGKGRAIGRCSDKLTEDGKWVEKKGDSVCVCMT